MQSSLYLFLIALFFLLSVLFLYLFVKNLLRNRQLTGTLELKEEALRERDERYRNELRLRDEALLLQKETFAEQSRAQEDRFKALSEEITQRRSRELSETNRSSMDAIITPLKETITKMEKALKESSESDAKREGALREAMDNMMKESKAVGLKADALASALRAKPKLQGNWGEEQLRRLLDLENFTEGVDYETQVTLKGDAGNALRPDFILHFPDNKDIIIDSKVSLTAFTAYIEAEDDETRALKSKENLRSVRDHIDELRRKKYQTFIKEPRKALDYVVMFVPNEMALSLAYQEQPDLWQEAIDAGVFLASQQNLMVLLRLIRIAWTQDAQMRNYRELSEHAARLIERAERMVPEMENIGKKIGDLEKAYNAFDSRLRGKQGILTSARKISELSGKVSQSLTSATEE